MTQGRNSGAKEWISIIRGSKAEGIELFIQLWSKVFFYWRKCGATSRHYCTNYTSWSGNVAGVSFRQEIVNSMTSANPSGEDPIKMGLNPLCFRHIFPNSTRIPGIRLMNNISRIKTVIALSCIKRWSKQQPSQSLITGP